MKPTPEQHAKIIAIHTNNELDMAILIRRLCRVITKHDAHNTVRAGALDFLHRKGFGGSPLKGTNETNP